ncbi:MAG: ABC transporter permease subunit [Planctomycetaceae bacterium]
MLQPLFAAASSPFPMIGILLALLVGGLLLANSFTRAGAVARGTVKEAVRQPAFLLTIGVTALFLIALKYIPFFAGKEETKFYIECSLATILLSGLTLGVWLASTSVADEIEGKTAMTLLSKPVNRRQFVLGKYLGILQTLLLLVVVSGVLLYFFTYEKTGYDARESSSGRLDFVEWTSVSWLPFEVPTAVPQRWDMATRTIPGLTLIFMEIAVVTAISVAISTRVPMLVNVVTCLTIFVVGHLTTVLVQSALKDQVFVVFVARLLSTVLPTLESFNMDAAIATGRAIPAEYIGYSALYSTCYITAAILLGFILFEDRDLA